MNRIRSGRRTAGRAALVAFLATATAAALQPGASAATGSAPSSAAVEACGHGSAVTRPDSMTLACADGGEIAQDLHWTDWSAHTATATGLVSWHACAASCAKSQAWQSTAAQVTLSAPTTEPDGKVLFTKLTLHVTGSTPSGFQRDLTFDEAPVQMLATASQDTATPRATTAPHAAAAVQSAAQPAATSGTLGYAAIEGYWIDADGPSSQASVAAAITGAESSFLPGEIQQDEDYCSSGSEAGWGLWQITCGNSVPAYGTDFQLLDPWNNAEAAVAKYNEFVAAGANGFDAWTTYNDGAYKNYLQSVAPNTDLTDPGEYVQIGSTPPGTPASPAADPGSTYGPKMPGSSPTPNTSPDGSHQASRVVAQNDGVVDLLYQGTDGAVDHDWYQPTSGWSGPASVGGTPASEPSTVNTVAGTVDSFWKGTDGNLWHAFTTGGAWNAPVSLGYGPLGSAPVAIGQANGTINVFWRGTNDDHLWMAQYTAGVGWSSTPVSLGGDIAANTVPAPVSSVAGTTDVFFKGTDGNLWHTYTDNYGKTWSAATSLGYGTLGSSPAATGHANGSIDVFWRGTNDDHLWLAHYTAGGSWSTQAQNLGGDIAPGTVPAPVTSVDTTTDVFFEGTDGALWHAFSSDYGVQWNGPVSLGMATISQPFAAGQTNGTVDVFWKGTADNHIWHAFYTTTTGWSTSPTSMGGSAK